METLPTVNWHASEMSTQPLWWASMDVQCGWVKSQERSGRVFQTLLFHLTVQALVQVCQCSCPGCAAVVDILPFVLLAIATWFPYLVTNITLFEKLKQNHGDSCHCQLTCFRDVYPVSLMSLHGCAMWLGQESRKMRKGLSHLALSLDSPSPCSSLPFLAKVVLLLWTFL